MGWGSSDVEKAQRLANEANIAMTTETNKQNYDIAHEANLWNWNNLQAQNEWNIQQWERENAYNDPSAQMERMIKAGINPIFATGGIDAGNAQHLESGAPQPAQTAQMQAAKVSPEYDPYMQARLGNIIAASRDLMNAGLGFKHLGIEQQQADTARAAQMSQEQLNRASVVEKRAATQAIQVQTDWNLSTFGTRADLVAQELATEKAKLNNYDASTEAYKSQKALYDANRDFVRAKTDRIAEDYDLKWQELDVARKQAQASLMSASAQQESVNLGEQRLNFDKSRFEAEVQHWSNQDKLDWLHTFSAKIKAGGEVSGQAGSDYLGWKVIGKTSVNGEVLVAPDEEKLRVLGYQAIKAYGADPTPENAKVAKEYMDFINTYVPAHVDAVHSSSFEGYDSSNTSVLNPSFEVDPLESFGSRSPWQ